MDIKNNDEAVKTDKELKEYQAKFLSPTIQFKSQIELGEKKY